MFTLSLLAIEDDSDDIELLKQYFEDDSDIQLTFAGNLSDGVAALTKKKFDVILLDLSLPDSTSEETFFTLHDQCPDTPIVVFTRTTHLKNGITRVIGTKNGAQDYLIKGKVDAEQLRLSVRNAVERNNAEKLKEELLHKDRLATIGQISAGVAHELNNPASFVNYNLSFLEENMAALKDIISVSTLDKTSESASTEQIEFALDHEKTKSIISDTEDLIAEAKIGMERICSITQNLRSFSGMDSSELKTVDLNKLVNEALNMLNPEIRGQFNCHVALESTFPIVANEGKILQVITNLLLNATQAIHESKNTMGSLEIRARKVDDGNLLTFKDNGIGMSADVKRKIFDPFFTTKGAKGGTGLGLSICNEIVQLHGGYINVESKPMRGTTIDVWIPKDTGLTANKNQGQHQSKTHESIPLRILIVDDEPLLLKALERTLSKTNQVTTVFNGLEALEVLSQNAEFDLIFCDLLMDKMSGLKLFGQVSRIYPKLTDRFVFMSGGVLDPTVIDRLTRSKNQVLTKPLDRNALATVLRSFEERSQKRKTIFMKPLDDNAKEKSA